MATILVTDGEQRASLAAVRSLGRAGHTVYSCSARPRSLAGASRYCRKHFVTPDPLRAPEEFVAAIQQLASECSVDVVLPITEPALLALLPRRGDFPGVTIPFVDVERFRRICDKAAVMESARNLGIGVPAQTRIETPADVAAFLNGPIRYPLVLKPSRSVSEQGGSLAKTSVMHIPTEEALRAALDGLPAGVYPILAQARIVGPGVGVFLLLWDGEVRAAFSHRRIREKPPAGGVSVYRESYPLDAQLLEHSRALLGDFSWEGVAMVEYKIDATSGTPYIMEINGRFWGSLQLAIDAGVDFPSLLVASALGESPQPVQSYRTGVRSRWTWGEIDHLLARFRRSREELSLTADAPGRARSLVNFLRSFGPGNRDEVFQPSDPRPALRETLTWFRGR